MVRILLRLVTAVVMLGFLLVPALATMSVDEASGVADPVTIVRYDADYTVGADGTLTATESVEADFPSGRHGIFRYWDLADLGDAGPRYRPRDVAITLDGASVPVSSSWENGRRFRVAWIGDPDRYLSPGRHTYRIRYRIEGVLAPTAARAPRPAAAGPAPTAARSSVGRWSPPGGACRSVRPGSG